MFDNIYLFTLCVIWTIWCLVSYWKWWATIYRPLRKVTLGFRLPIIGTMYRLLLVKREDFFTTAFQIAIDKRPIFCNWIGSTPDVGIVKPEYFEAITNNSTHIKKGNLYKFMLPWLGNGLVTSSGSKWHMHRKLITPAFHFKILESFMDVFINKTQILLKILDMKCDEKPFNIYPDITDCALDIICETSMGVSSNAMTNRNNSYVQSVHIMSEMILQRSMTPLPEFIYKRLSKGRLFQETLDTLHGFTDKVISERKEKIRHTAKEIVEKDTEDDVLGKKERLSFLDLMLAASEDGKLISDKELREQVDTLMFGGHDTITANICWNLFLLGHHPEIQEKVFKEVHSILQDKATPTIVSELSDMKYLECVIKETLRLYPSVPVISRKIEEEMTLGEYKIPASSNITLYIYALHRLPETFPNPSKFDPERFFPENNQNRHPYAYMPFSAGPRNCIGQKFVMYEEKTLLSSLINRYKITAVEASEDIKFAIGLVLKPLKGTILKLERRQYNGKKYAVILELYLFQKDLVEFFGFNESYACRIN